MRAPAVQSGECRVSDDQSYLAARAGEERRQAMAAANPNVRRIHLEMAARYAALAGKGAAPRVEVCVKRKERTA
jgi:hypothetical protein